MIKKNPLLQKDYRFLHNTDIVLNINKLMALADKYISEFETDINIITYEENIELHNLEDLGRHINEISEDIRIIAVIFQNHKEKSICIIFRYQEQKVEISLMLDNKDINKETELEIKNILGLEEIFRDDQILINTSQMVINPIFKSREFVVKKNTCFTVMPFSEKWSNRVNKKIEKVLASLDIEYFRADNLYGSNVLEDIWKAINEASLIIADTTGKNPNVFYEIGIAHTLGKAVILITQDIEDIPFDFRSYRHISYQDNIDGFEYLEKELIKYIEAL